MVGHACPGPLGGEGSGFRSIRYSDAGAERTTRGCWLSRTYLERRVAVLRDDDVLKYGYPEQSPRLFQPVRYLSILRRWRRVPARVIVSDDNRGCIVQYRGREDVAGMHDRGVDRPYRYYLLVYQLVPRIEIQAHEMLFARRFDVL